MVLYSQNPVTNRSEIMNKDISHLWRLIDRYCSDNLINIAAFFGCAVLEGVDVRDYEQLKSYCERFGIYVKESKIK